jgi:hypothetical protein
MAFVPPARYLLRAKDLKGRGVDFVEAPHERPYGIDTSFRDPSGNHFRLTRLREALV